VKVEFGLKFEITFLTQHLDPAMSYRKLLYAHIALICGYKEAIQETYMACICTYMHLKLPICAIFTHLCSVYFHICAYAVYMQHICAYKLHIGFINAHISSYRFFPCGNLLSVTA